MKSLNRAEAAGFLLVNDDFCILTHRRPDGDTIGSAAALCLGLRQLGKRAHVLINPDATTTRCNWLLEGLTVEERQVFCAAMEKLLQRAREGRRSCYSQVNTCQKEEGDGTCI